MATHQSKPLSLPSQHEDLIVLGADFEMARQLKNRH